jgi:hypothetical protein
VQGSAPDAAVEIFLVDDAAQGTQDGRGGGDEGDFVLEEFVLEVAGEFVGAVVEFGLALGGGA